MERVYLLVEDMTQRRLPCLLNPETLVQRRLAGVQPRRSATGRLTGTGLTDDPMLYTGGGYTELALDLLFDVALVDRPQKIENVRTLTQPLWDLADTPPNGLNRGQPLMVRFLWGKEWNFLGVVVAVAERLDMFTSEGVPQRSWLRLKLVRSQLPAAEPEAARRSPTAAELASLAERVSQAPGGLIALGRPEPGAPGSDQPSGSPEPEETEAPPEEAEGEIPGLEGAVASEAVPEETEAPLEEAEGESPELEGADAPEMVPEETEGTSLELEGADAPKDEQAASVSAAEVPQEGSSAGMVKLEATGLPDTEPATLSTPVAAQAAADSEQQGTAGPVEQAESEASAAPAEPEGRWRMAQRERLDQVAHRYYGDPAYWRLLAIVNGIDDPLHIPDGTELRVPSIPLESEGA